MISYHISSSFVQKVQTVVVAAAAAAAAAAVVVVVALLLFSGHTTLSLLLHAFLPHLLLLLSIPPRSYNDKLYLNFNDGVRATFNEDPDYIVELGDAYWMSLWGSLQAGPFNTDCFASSMCQPDPSFAGNGDDADPANIIENDDDGTVDPSNGDGSYRPPIVKSLRA